MTKIIRFTSTIFFLIFFTAAVFADIEFGFGDDVESSESNSYGNSVLISGEIGSKFVFFPSEFDTFKQEKLLDIFTAKLKLNAHAANAEAEISVKLDDLSRYSTYTDVLDEAFVRAFIGRFTILGGIKKLSWGKADSFGPLDVVNPLNYSDLLHLDSVNEMKIARPMLHAQYALGNFSKVEAVFVPYFEGLRYAKEGGRWASKEVTNLPVNLKKSLAAWLGSTAPAGSEIYLPYIIDEINSSNTDFTYPDTETIFYAQAGARFTTSLFSSDFGFQYYYGRLERPAIILDGLEIFWQQALEGEVPSIKPYIAYNGYHQVGIDWAQVIQGFNIRAEAAANITSDISGDMGDVYNPAVLWSLGFDRDVFAGINANFQINEKIILGFKNIADNRALDTEADKKATSTRMTIRLSKKLFKDMIELKNTIVWGVEDMDCLILPSVSWTKGDLNAEVSSGIFCGNREGELGQYGGNCYLKALMKFTF